MKFILLIIFVVCGLLNTKFQLEEEAESVPLLAYIVVFFLWWTYFIGYIIEFLVYCSELIGDMWEDFKDWLEDILDRILMFEIKNPFSRR